MQKFLRDVIVFSFGLLACFGGVYAFNTFTLTLNAPQVESEVLIVGDSHTRDSLNPELFVSARNISQNAEPYYVTYWKLKRLLSDSPVETVLLGFAHHNISAFNDQKLSDERWSSELFRRTYMFGEIDSLEGINIDRMELFRTRIKNMFLIPRWSHDSYMGHYENWNTTDLTDPDKPIARHFLRDGGNMDMSEVELAFLDSIVALSVRENIELILVTTPVHVSYYERIPDHFIAGFEDKQRELEARGIRVLDYSQLDVVDDEFLNITHLNEKGATRFSKLVSKRIAEIME